MRRFLVKKIGDCGSLPTPKKPKADSERLFAAREDEERRRRVFKAAWRDEFAWSWQHSVVKSGLAGVWSFPPALKKGAKRS